MESILISQISKYSVRFVIIGILKILDLKINHFFAMDDYSMIIQNLGDTVILKIKEVDYRWCVVNMSKKDATSLLNNSILDNKRVS